MTTTPSAAAAAALQPSRKMNKAQIIIVTLLAFVAIIPFTVRHPFTTNEQQLYPTATSTTKSATGGLLRPMTMSDLPPSTRIKKEIILLEKDVESLETLSFEQFYLSSSFRDSVS